MPRPQRSPSSDSDGLRMVARLEWAGTVRSETALMAMTKDQIVAEAKSLDAKDRQQLIEDLRRLSGDDDLTPEQREELRRRIEAVGRGEAKLIDGDQAIRALREELGIRCLRRALC